MTRRMGLAVVVVAWALVAVTACTGPSPSSRVDYDVTGTATRVDITYATAGGGTAQVTGVTVPWSFGWSGAKTGDFLYVSAQIVNTTGGTLTVTIKKDGSRFKTTTSSGFASIATASGTY